MPFTKAVGLISTRFALTIALASALGAFSSFASQDAFASASNAKGVAWVNPDSGDASAVFARARKENKPVFLFWTAKWCPPCNRVKATVFSSAQFIEASKSFIPLYVDGDAPGAQRLAAQYTVVTYPTSIVFAPDGREITRLPGEVEPAKYMRLMSLGMKATRPVKQLVDGALSGETLSADEWDLLTFYSWETDRNKVVAEKDLATTLQKLAQRAADAKQPKIASRLQLKALLLAALQSVGTKAEVAAVDRAAAYTQLTHTLADAQAVGEDNTMLALLSGYLTRYATKANSPERKSLQASFNSMLDSTIKHTESTHSDRLNAMLGKIKLAELDLPDASTAKSKERPNFPESLVTQARYVVKAADTQTTDRITRQAIMSNAAYVLSEVGLLDESDALLKSEVTKAISPHYFLSHLSQNAKKRGDKAAAINYAQQAYERGEGPATRLEWGVHYVRALLADAPQDTTRIVTASKLVLSEAQSVPDAFYERSLLNIQSVGRALNTWAKDDASRKALADLRNDLDRICEKLPANEPAAANCRGALRPKA
jgi:thiol-disulfide isomerase/thioredoxin